MIYLTIVALWLLAIVVVALVFGAIAGGGDNDEY